MKKKSLLYIKTSDFKQIDIQTECSWTLEWCSCSNMYIFEDPNSNIIGIEYIDLSTNKESKYDHQIKIHLNNNVVQDIHLPFLLDNPLELPLQH